MTELNYYVDLRADFPHPDSYVDPTQPSGKELAAILVDGLPAHGIAVCRVEGVDFCHYVDCLSGSSTIQLMVGAEVLGEEKDRWYIQACSKESYFTRKDHPKADYRRLLLAVDATLQENDRVADIRWFPGYETPNYLALLPHSSGPLRDADYEQQLNRWVRLDWRFNRITNVAFSPVGFLLAVALFCALALIFPAFVGQIALTCGVIAVALLLFVQTVIDAMVAREARYGSRDGD